MDKKGVPIYIWLMVLLTSLGLIITDRYFVSKQTITNQQAESQLRILKDSRSTDKIYKVLVFGSSRLASAIEDVDVLNQKIMRKAEHRVDVKFFSTPNAELEHFLSNLKTYVLIRGYKPDLILIQSDLLLYFKKGEKSIMDKMAERVLKRTLNSTDDRRIFKGYEEEENHWNPKLDSSEYRTVRKYLFEKFDLRTIPFDNDLVRNMNGIKSDGTKFIALDIPYPKATMEFKDKGGFTSIEINSMKEIKEEYGIDFWEYDDSYLYFKDFRDFVHFNKSGKTLFSAWFVDNLSDHLKQQKQIGSIN